MCVFTLCNPLVLRLAIPFVRPIYALLFAIPYLVRFSHMQYSLCFFFFCNPFVFYKFIRCVPWLMGVSIGVSVQGFPQCPLLGEVCQPFPTLGTRTYIGTPPLPL